MRTRIKLVAVVLALTACQGVGDDVELADPAGPKPLYDQARADRCKRFNRRESVELYVHCLRQMRADQIERRRLRQLQRREKSEQGPEVPSESD